MVASNAVVLFLHLSKPPEEVEEEEEEEEEEGGKEAKLEAAAKQQTGRRQSTSTWQHTVGEQSHTTHRVHLRLLVCFFLVRSGTCSAPSSSFWLAPPPRGWCWCWCWCQSRGVDVASTAGVHASIRKHAARRSGSERRGTVGATGRREDARSYTTSSTPSTSIATTTATADGDGTAAITAPLVPQTFRQRA
jgi:hypothetical protein